METLELNGLRHDEMKELFRSMGEPSYRADQLFNFFNKNCGVDLEAISVLPRKLKERLAVAGEVVTLKIVERIDSKYDETRKYVMKTRGGACIETVYMKTGARGTLCISTQAGCRMGCQFCASTKAPFRGNLSTAELLQQVYLVEQDLDEPVTNLVLMGIGEPLDNYENVVKFLEIIHDVNGRNMSHRNITLSTCGLVPQIDRLAEENFAINLAISLHYPFDKERRRFMPIAKRYSIAELLDACSRYYRRTKRRVSFEYVMIEGLNDSETHAKELAKILKSMNCHVNLIPLNPVAEFEGGRSSRKRLEFFQRNLQRHGVNTTIRKSMGADIEAACGQLRKKHEEAADR